MTTGNIAGLIVLFILVVAVAARVGYRLGEDRGFERGLTRSKRQRDREIETLRRTHVEELNAVAVEWKRKLEQERADRAEEQARQAEAEEQARRAEEAKRRSPWARDIPESRVFEVAAVPYETVTLRAELHLDDRDLMSTTKVDLLQRLRGELVKDVWQYVDIDRYDEPWLVGSTFRATLRVLQRKGCGADGQTGGG